MIDVQNNIGSDGRHVNDEVVLLVGRDAREVQ